MASKKKVVKPIEYGKKLLKSKTFWFNLLAIIVTVASQFGFSEFEPSEEIAELTVIFAGVVNILLRVKTSEPITRI